MTSLYHAGADINLPFTIKIEIPNKISNPTHADLIMRWIEFWCQSNCESHWSVNERHNHVEVAFDSELDVVLFKLSPEFNFP